MIFPCMSHHCKLVPVQHREYDINLFLMIFPRMSHHCELVPVQYREYDINLFLMIFPRTSFYSKQVPVQYTDNIQNQESHLRLLSYNCTTDGNKNSKKGYLDRNETNMASES